MRIKKVQRNEYIFAEGVWIRNFAKRRVKESSINRMYSENDFNLIANNEMENLANNQMSFINDESWNFPNIVIVSDGYDFKEKQHLLAALPKDVAIFAVNGALKKWELQGKASKASTKKSINIYVCNNPYRECMAYMPTSYYPTCVMSTRTNLEFVQKYKGNKYLYVPTAEESISSFCDNNISWHIDDYRNPVCAAISLAYRCNVNKLLLFCCDHSFSDKRPGAVQLENGLWQYPQQRMAHSIIDSNLYWLAQPEAGEVIIGDHSACEDYINAQYIQAENIKDFFS